jgi:pilus assembly protein CpaB
MANNLTKILAVALIVIAVLLGVYAWVLGSRSPSAPVVSGQPAAQTKLVPVVVAVQPLKAGVPIAASSLKLQQVAARPDGAFVDPVQIIGRVPSADIPEQAAVVESSLSSGMADLVEPGERAIAVKVDENNAVGNRVRPGNFVDVFVNLKRDAAGGIPGTNSSGPEIPKTQAKLLLSKIRVLAFGDATTARDQSGGAAGGVRTAVLAVPTAQIDALTLAESSGNLTLALRSPRDEEVATQTVAMRVGTAADPSARAAQGLSLSELSRGVADAPAAAAAPRRTAPARVVARSPDGGSIEVIRGGRAESVAY